MNLTAAVCTLLAGAAFVADGAAAAAAGVVAKPGPAKPPARFRWEQVADKSVALVGPCGIVWQLNFGAELTKPHFHPLQTADGRCLTQVSPPDHRWHYGLWHSWKFIDGVNYWEEDQGGRPAGVTRIAQREILRLDDAGARFRLTLEYFPRDRKDAVVMADTVELQIETPQDDGCYRIWWTQTSRASRHLRLDRTPLPGEPDGKDYGGYAGLSFRGDRFMSEVTLRTSTGKSDADAQRKPASWAAFTGNVDRRPASIAIFDHPANTRHPTPWYCVMRKSRGNAPYSPFWYLNAAFLNDAPFELAPDRPLTLRYLVRVDNFPPSADALGAEFERFAKTQPTPNRAAP
jgi:hypothetical protein